MKYREDLSSSLYSLLPQTQETEFSKAVMELQSEVRSGGGAEFTSTVLQFEPSGLCVSEQIQAERQAGDQQQRFPPDATNQRDGVH